MTSPIQRDTIRQSLSQLDPSATSYATEFVDQILSAARQACVSDVHLQPVGDGLDVRWRLDGVLRPVGRFPRGAKSDVVTRLKVMAGLLT